MVTLLRSEPLDWCWMVENGMTGASAGMLEMTGIAKVSVHGASSSRRPAWVSAHGGLRLPRSSKRKTSYKCRNAQALLQLLFVSHLLISQQPTGKRWLRPESGGEIKSSSW